MKIQLALSKRSYGAGESMRLSVELFNDGAAPVEVPDPGANSSWQPTYTVVGPAFPQGVTVSFRGAVHGETRGPQAKTRTFPLQPGEGRAAELPLDQLVPALEPGDYFLTANLSWNGLEATSAPLPFAVSRSRIRSCQLLARPGLEDSGIQAICLVRPEAGAEDGPGSVQFAAFRENPQTGVLSRSSLDPYATPGGGAETILGPWMSYTGLGTPSPRAVYVAGKRLAALAFESQGGLELTLPFAPLALRPALGVSSGELDLFVIDLQRPAIGLVRVPRERKGAGPPVLLAEQTLPRSVAGGRAALAAPGGAERRYAVLASDGETGSTLTLVDAGDGRSLALHPVGLAGLHALPSSEPALHVDAAGRARAAVLVLKVPTREPGVEVELVEVTWEADRTREPIVRATTAALLPAPPRAAAATYSVSPGPIRLAWAIWTAEGLVRSSVSPEARPLQGTPPSPLELLAAEDLTALLTFDPAGAPGLERL